MTDDLIPKPEQCGASARIQIGPMPYIGPCILRHGHDGPVHQDAAGAQWTNPRPATAEDSAGLCPASLRDQIAEALPCPVCPAQAGEPCVRARADNQQPHMSRRLRADAVTPVVEAALTRARAACCDDGERTYAEMERHLTRRAEEAEKQRDAAHRMMERFPDVHMKFGVVGVVEPEDATCADWCYACRLEHAEAAVRRVQTLVDSYPPGSQFARSGAQALFRVTLCTEGRPDETLAAVEAEQPKAAPRPDDTWTIAVQVPISLPTETRHALFTAIANAVTEWEPDDRDGWDADVSGYPTADSLHAWQAEATVQRSREALAAFDGRGVSTPEGTDWNIPTAGEVLDAWRASLDSEPHKETQ